MTPVVDRDVAIRVNAGAVTVAGNLTIPDNACGIVIFAHGSGSSRHSPRNQYVAEALNEAGIATLLFDLLTPEEEFDRTNVFDIGLLASRLVDVTGWLAVQPDTVLPTCSRSWARWNRWRCRLAIGSSTTWSSHPDQRGPRESEGPTAL